MDIKRIKDKLTQLSIRVSDGVTNFAGSWKFIFLFGGILTGWVAFNGLRMFDPYRFDKPPFILLNLCLSFIAAFQAPFILMSQNRQEEKQRQMDEKQAQTIDAIYKLAEAGQADNKTKFEILGRVVETMNLQSDVLQHISKEVQNRKVETTNGNQRSKND